MHRAVPKEGKFHKAQKSFHEFKGRQIKRELYYLEYCTHFLIPLPNYS